MNAQRWMLVASLPLLFAMGFVTFQARKFESRMTFQSRSEETIDALLAIASPQAFVDAAGMLDRQTAMMVSRLRERACSRYDRDEYFQQWLDVAKAYKRQGFELGVRSNDLNAKVASRANEVLVAAQADEAFVMNAGDECQTLISLWNTNR